MTVHILTFEHLSIFEQLQIEEGLLRTSKENWVIINQGSPKAIVMGISAKPEEVVDLELARRDQIPLIQRFSGGGTVIVDENTLFISFIFQKEMHDFELFPTAILNWAGDLVHRSLDLPNFLIQESDFALNNKKIGGNAQYIKKDRFLHHTSFLWDFHPKNMSYLLHPPKEPAYRKGRPHTDFLTTLSPHLTKQEFEDRFIYSLSEIYPTTLNHPLPSFPSHRTSTTLR
jgi:lipoate-protein ligase A